MHFVKLASFVPTRLVKFRRGFFSLNIILLSSDEEKFIRRLSVNVTLLR